MIRIGNFNSQVHEQLTNCNDNVVTFKKMLLKIVKLNPMRLYLQCSMYVQALVLKQLHNRYRSLC